MNNEKGVTLIELLISVVIAGIVIVPLMLIMTGSFIRTTEQGRDTQLIYFGQQVMEEIRQNGYKPGDTKNYPIKYFCKNGEGCISEQDSSISYDAIVEIQQHTQPTVIYNNFYEIKVVIQSLTHEADTYELVTAVKK